MVQTGYHGKFLYRKGGQNTGRGFLERWLLSSDCQHSRDVWITPLIVYCNIWLALKWSSTWTRCLKAPCNGTILFLFLFCKGSTKQIHPLCLNFLLCVLNSSGCTISVLSPNSARHLIMSNLTGFGKIDVLVRANDESSLLRLKSRGADVLLPTVFPGIGALNYESIFPTSTL